MLKQFFSFAKNQHLNPLIYIKRSSYKCFIKLPMSIIKYPINQEKANKLQFVYAGVTLT